ncbi:MAG: LapA family protein [bacterium]
MQYLRIVAELTVLGLVAAFVYQNSDFSVPLYFWRFKTASLPVGLLMVASCIAGVAIMGIFGGVRELMLRGRIRRDAQKIRRLEEELASSKRLPVPTESSGGGTGSEGGEKT